MADNTLFLRLAGPMQSWGTQSKFQLRRTDLHPSKSAVLGLLLCTQGVTREDSAQPLAELATLAMGVRIDQSGTVQADYQTAGAKIGIRQPSNGKPKKTASTKLPEVQLSRRQYLYGASFLVALKGDPELIGRCKDHLENPVWPPYLGRKCCIPSEPIFVRTGTFDTLVDALESIPWRCEQSDLYRDSEPCHVEREAWVESVAPASSEATQRIVYDVPARFGYWNYQPRQIVRERLTVQMEFLPRPDRPRWVDPYGPDWSAKRTERLEHDGHQCVFCQSPATQVHHLDYNDVRLDTLRSVCELCHDACTMIEYAQGDHPERVDPADPSQRDRLLEQIERILAGRRKQRRRKLLQER